MHLPEANRPITQSELHEGLLDLIDRIYVLEKFRPYPDRRLTTSEPFADESLGFFLHGAARELIESKDYVNEVLAHAMIQSSAVDRASGESRPITLARIGNRDPWRPGNILWYTDDQPEGTVSLGAEAMRGLFQPPARP